MSSILISIGLAIGSCSVWCFAVYLLWRAKKDKEWGIFLIMFIVVISSGFIFVGFISKDLGLIN